MSLTIASGRDVRNVSRPRLAESATRTVAPHSSSIARITSRVSSSSSTTSTVVPSSSMGDRCTPSLLRVVWENFFRRNVDERTHEETRATSFVGWRAKSSMAFRLRAGGARRCLPMKSSGIVFVAIVVILAAHAAAIAGPGDPRLVNGVLEWPRALTNEPFIVVRGDDGALYYVTITAARRDAALTSGARIAVLGLEGRTVHEITALGVGAGDSAASALANLQNAKSASDASAPTVVTPPTVAAPTTPSAPVPTTASPAAPANGSAAAIAAPAAKAPGVPTQAGVVPGTRAPAATNTTTTPGFGPYPAIISAPTTPPAVAATAPASAPSKPTTPEVAPTSLPMPSLA